MKTIEEGIKWIVRNWDSINDEEKTDLRPNRYSSIDNLSTEEHIVILLVDRQKPSVERDYNFDEERIGVNRKGKVIWGFDSGCSCPSPWYDSFPKCYNVSKTWKEFEINIKEFDKDIEKECLNTINHLIERVTKGDKK